MRDSLKPGVQGTAGQRVVSEQLVSARLPGAPAALASPWMLYLMELAAYHAVEPHLDDGETSVGVRFDFEHLAATPAGMNVEAKATVEQVEGRLVTLRIEARDERELIGRGMHVRAVVDVERFNEKLRKKRGG